jgi:hypothetical protein
MKTTKTFDCVEMKDRIQRDLMAEYERRRDEFSSYVAFINATADADPKIQAFRARLAQSPTDH